MSVVASKYFANDVNLSVGTCKSGSKDQRVTSTVPVQQTNELYHAFLMQNKNASWLRMFLSSTSENDNVEKKFTEDLHNQRASSMQTVTHEQKNNISPLNKYL